MPSASSRSNRKMASATWSTPIVAAARQVEGAKARMTVNQGCTWSENFGQ